MTVQTSAGQADGAGALIARLRAQHAAQSDKSTQALLLHECGVLEETSGEEPIAARDYLAAFNADPQLREPLEALVRILSRRKSVKNLGKLLDALTRAAATPEERTRAFWERASYLQTYEQNVAGAKELYEEAITGSPEEPVLWLELELCAAKLGDAEARLRALEARAQLANHPTWKALLFIDLAELCASTGDHARAYDLLDAAAALEGKARFRTQLVLEQVAAKEDNLEALARALEGQGHLIEEAIEDEPAGDLNGVPRFMRTPAYAADAWLRAAFIHLRMGDAATGAPMLERAGERLPESSVIARARLASLEAAGQLDEAASLAMSELGRGLVGPGAASLWLRVAEAAIRRSDREAAIDALRNALQFDKASIPARALEIDELGEGSDTVGLASSLESLADTYAAAAPKGRAYLLAAWVWGTQAGDADAARAALIRAGDCGVPAVVTARVARTLSALRSDTIWFETATKALLAALQKDTSSDGVGAAEQPSLWFELGRSQLLRGDEAGATEAFARLAEVEDGASAWLGRALGAYALGLTDVEEALGDGDDERPLAKKPQSPAAIEELAKVETDPEMARALWVVTALRSARSGDVEGARKGLRDLHQAVPGDAVVAIFRAELDRRAGDVGAAADTLSSCAKETADADFAAALHLEAALLMWGKGERTRAVEQIESARALVPRAGATMLSWALRGADPDTTEGRRRALDAGAEAGADASAVALERFGLESAAGEPADALEALEALEVGAEGDLAIASALARLLWPAALEQRDAVERALDLLEDRGADATALARAERFRLARTLDEDRVLAASRAAEWAAADPELYAALEWIGAAMAADDRDAEIAARRVAATHFSGAARAAMEASASMATLVDQPLVAQGFIQGSEVPGQLMNLELALPGCDPRRRSAALHGLGEALGADAQIDAIALAGWSDLAAGKIEEARTSFQTVIDNRPGDVAAWEGMRAASEAIGDHVQMALSAAQLGSLCVDDVRGAAFWEQAGVILLEHTEAKDDAEIAFERSFFRDARRAVAFDKLFRAVRARNEDDRLLDIIARRLEVTEDDLEIGKMYWERARVLRKKGDLDGALASLENVTMLEPDHVGALALLGEVCITKKMFAEAAPYLARLSTIEEAPRQQRLMSGIAAVDLFENKLGKLDKALEVLTTLHKAGLSTPQVRERLARVAARAGAWADATSILEQLMVERDKREGRIEAARFVMTVWRDKLNAPIRATRAVHKLLEEAPDDAEAIAFVLNTPFEASMKTTLLTRAKHTLLGSLSRAPANAAHVDLLSQIGAFEHDAALRQATLGALFALGRGSAPLAEELGKLDGRVAACPQIVLDDSALREIADPDDAGPIGELFVQMSEIVALALGPTLGSLGITKKDRVDARGAPPIRVVLGEWMGALGLVGDWDLYVGGAEPLAVYGIAGDPPAIVLGSGITLPLDAAARSAVAREVYALKRGISSVRLRTENTIASLVVAACIEAGFNVPTPPYTAFAEVSRGVKKEMTRKVRKAIPDVCQRILASGQDPLAWAVSARRSTDRMAVIAAGDVSVVLSDVLKVPRADIGNVILDSDRALRLLAFVLSPSYLELRKKLGMGVR